RHRDPGLHGGVVAFVGSQRYARGADGVARLEQDFDSYGRAGRSDPRAVVSVIALSQASYRKMVQNLASPTGYNVLAIPLAAGALAWAGVTLAPAVGGILMSVSTVVVALNAQLLRRLDLRPHSTP